MSSRHRNNNWNKSKECCTWGVNSPGTADNDKLSANANIPAVLEGPSCHNRIVAD